MRLLIAISLLFLVVSTLPSCMEKKVVGKKKKGWGKKSKVKTHRVFVRRASEAEACRKGIGEAKRQLKKICADTGVNYDKLNFGKCKVKKISKKKYTAEYNVKYLCNKD